eukprot:3146477-Prymnesium_polylepis.1
MYKPPPLAALLVKNEQHTSSMMPLAMYKPPPASPPMDPPVMFKLISVTFTFPVTRSTRRLHTLPASRTTLPGIIPCTVRYPAPAEQCRLPC